MTVTAESFVLHFPEFSDSGVYSDDTIAFWLGLAGVTLDPLRWAGMLDYGTELFMAHNLALGRGIAGGGSTGASPSLLSGKTVDKVSVRYDTGAGAIAGGGSFNLTTYGNRFLQLVNIVGIGGIQL